MLLLRDSLGFKSSARLVTETLLGRLMLHQVKVYYGMIWSIVVCGSIL